MPCPLCGGLIHPVAGRCKHCKEDLTQFRAGRPQAAAALPALNGARTAVAAQTAVPVYIPGTNGHAPAANGAPVAVVQPAREGSQPILPQRPTGRSMRAEHPRAAWKSWPMLVIAIAVVAILVAVVIMVLPQDKPKAGARKLPPTPAPERMETNPLPPKASQIDPWSQPDMQPAPAQPQPQAPQAAPDDPDDLFGGLNGAGGLGVGGGAGAVMLHVVDKVCTKLKDCPDLDQTLISTTCDQLKAFPKPPLPSNCPAAQRCLDAVDSLSCNSATGTSPLTVMYQISECTAALTDC